MKIDGSDLQRVSTGKGRTTCGYFYPGSKQILFASTHEASARRVRRSRVTSAATSGRSTTATTSTAPIADGIEPDAADDARPATTPRRRSRPTASSSFTSVRDGDMEIYSMNADGSDVQAADQRPGPDGGPFFSWDGKQVAFRGKPLHPGPELDDYRGAAEGRACGGRPSSSSS